MGAYRRLRDEIGGVELGDPVPVDGISVAFPKNALIKKTGFVSETVSMDFLKALPFLALVLGVTALGLFGSGHLAATALTLLGLLVMRLRP